MSSLDNIYQKMAPTLDSTNLAQLRSEPPPPDAKKQIGTEVAHDLNNILTIIQGYAQRMLIKHGDNPALRSDLQIICDNSRRAVAVVRAASPARSGLPTPRA